MATNILAVLWDLDGVLIDTIDAHFFSWENTLQKYGILFTRDQFKEVFGLHNESTLIHILGPKEAERIGPVISAEKEEDFRKRLQGNVTLLPGVDSWLNRLHQDGIPAAIASSAPMENIDIVVDESGTRCFFNAIVSGVGHPGKPDPWVFQEAARRLKVEPENCLVIEDSVAGVTGAKAGGMRCLAVTNTNPGQILKDSSADWTIDSLKKIYLTDIT
jgi:beta-phosphoglucomutase